MNNEKKEIAKIIISAFENQENYYDYLNKQNEINLMEKIKNDMVDNIINFNDISKEFILNKIEDFNSQLSILQDDLKLYLSKDQLEVREDALLNQYMNLSKKNKLHDVVFDFNSIYPGGTKTFKDIVKKLNKEGANIEYVYDKAIEKGINKDSSDRHMIVTMPADSYANFNTEINLDQDNSRYDVIGERQEYFLFPHLNKEVSLDLMRSEIKKSIEEDGYSNSSFSKDLSLGYVKLMKSNRDPELKIKKAIQIYLSQIRKMEFDGLKDGINYSISKNIMTSNYKYKKDDNNQEYSGKPVTPFKEAKRLLPEIVKLSNDKKNRLKNH